MTTVIRRKRASRLRIGPYRRNELRSGHIQYPVQGYTGYGDGVGTDLTAFISDEMRAIIGKEEPPVQHEVTKPGIRMFARAAGYTDLVFYDEVYAKSKGYRSLVAPPGFLGAIAFMPGIPVDAEGRPGAFQVRLPNPRGGLNGGNEFEYFDVPICAGDVLTSTAKTLSIKQARSGTFGQRRIARASSTIFVERLTTTNRCSASGLPGSPGKSRSKPAGNDMRGVNARWTR